MICLELHNEYIWNYFKKNEIFKVQKKKDIYFQGPSDLGETEKANI